MVHFRGAGSGRELCVTCQGGEGCMRGERVAAVRCGVTDGDGERQQSSLREEEEDMPVCQTPTPHYHSGTKAMPCPSTQ